MLLIEVFNVEQFNWISISQFDSIYSIVMPIFKKEERKKEKMHKKVRLKWSKKRPMNPPKKIKRKEEIRKKILRKQRLLKLNKVQNNRLRLLKRVKKIRKLNFKVLRKKKRQKLKWKIKRKKKLLKLRRGTQMLNRKICVALAKTRLIRIKIMI